MSFQASEPLTHDNAHGRPEGLDPRKNGPFLDDIRREQERAYREARMKRGKQTKAKDDDTQEIPVVKEESNNDSQPE